MKKSMFVLPFALMSAGCFTSSSPQPAQWTVEFAENHAAARNSPKFGVCRLLQVSVRAPYDSKSIAVMRPDGSLAFDPYNRFSAAPSALLKGAALDALQASGLFEAVVDSVSSVRTDSALELTVTRIALDCRENGGCRATVELSLSLVKRRELVKSVKATGDASVDGGDYSKAFSAALASAVEKAAIRL